MDINILNMNIYILLFIIIAIACIISLLLVGNKVSKRTIVLCFASYLLVAIAVISIRFYSEKSEQSIYIMTENDGRIEIALDNMKDYYGYRFYRFSTDSTSEEILEKVKETYDNAYYDETGNKIIFELNGTEYKIENEGTKKILWYESNKYLFSENEKQ